MRLESLKHKPGRRHTLRAIGARGNAIVKLYASTRATRVAARVAALADGPAEPRLPQVLHVDEALRMVVLSEVPGLPLGELLLHGQTAAAERAGTALGMWHRAWQEKHPKALEPHTPEHERETLLRQAERAPAPIAARVKAELPGLLEGCGSWDCSTVVHRDLYEEQILLDEAVGLIDLDDAALGPPELDIANLCAHLDLLALRSGRDLADDGRRLLTAYTQSGPTLRPELLQTFRRLTRLRLASIHQLRKLA